MAPVLRPVADRQRWWIDWLPEGGRPYAALARWDRPIGAWLLFWPCAWGLAAGPGRLDFEALIAMLIGAIAMRGAGCTINDIADRRYDASVERTKNRPLASGAIGLGQALRFLAAQLLVGAMVLSLLHPKAAQVAILALPLIVAYPLMKRITWWPQAFLGITFNWGALVGWTHQAGALEPAALLLWAAGVFWTLGYDTIYAHQDKDDDALIGVRSTARLLADASPAWIAGFYACCLTLLTAAAELAELGWALWAALPLVAAGLFVQLYGWEMNDMRSSLTRFRANHAVGALIFGALLLGKLSA